MRTLRIPSVILCATATKPSQSMNPSFTGDNETPAVPSGTVHCVRCNKDVQYHFNPVNHKKQLLLVILTIGLWLPMWLGMTLCPTKLCNECDGPIWDN